MKAVIELDVPEWQIGQDVSVYFPDTMVKHGKCELLKEQEAVMPILDTNARGIEVKCGVCRNMMWTIKDTAFADYPKKHIHYCSECGQAVKWNEN